ncbi:DUF6221 family protein [Streptomyces sp. NPDC088252]|uniref:DUF6221 family protein n=1 Tax=unclassified Streptomyces TaxID=2593676 RepID=UPI00381DBBDE
MDDLVQFLRDRLDEDEQIAHIGNASEPPLTWRQIGETGVIVASDGDRAEECANGNWAGVAEHIARHDPARVLREVEAKRELLSRYEAMAAGVLVMTGAEAILSEYRRVLLPHLALPYADHPDYRDTWRS